jgi:hypothetical protein
MPNWCNNNLTLEHEDPAMIQRAYDALERGEFLQEFIPVPKELTETMSGSYGDEAKQAALEAQTRANIDKFGYGNWYDFCVGEWGTKWDCGEQGASDIHPDGKLLHTSFDTAWAPPIAAYEKLLDLGFKVNAMYYEGGMCFAGIWEDGNDECYQDWGDSQGAIDTLPAELDECFAISESQAEYEAEEEEDLTEWLKDGKAANDKLALVSGE